MHVEQRREFVLGLRRMHDVWRAQDFDALRVLRREPGIDLGLEFDRQSLLFVAHKWHLAGSEVATVRWAADLSARGWRTSFATVRQAALMHVEQFWSYGAVVCATNAPIEMANRVYPYGAFGPRLVGGVHTTPSLGDHARICDLVVSNTSVEQHADRSLDSIVLHPPVCAYEPGIRQDPRGIVCVNFDSETKAPVLARAIARAFSSLPFYAVLGAYGRQIVPQGSNVVVIPNGLDSVREAFAKAQLLIAPSIRESYGMVIVEALMSGLDVVVSDLPGPHEAGGDAVTYVKSREPQEWIAAVTVALREPKARHAWLETVRRREQEELEQVHVRLTALVQGRLG